ncbi:Barrel-sandwich domain of CusB or HlyD membrane-fusion [Hymenobacter gelipurpurascens]|uniref:Barrel-sandwich domain of CusB or HlyD membrane-fusion n=1 Tax=Hymenobacter gelipurpurascens TaxID=89968 RepID=A0A212UEL7_9BACT|nr:efflux RND transporter periplasmic adaptor subunit [Hymenobacter gelipurpurascens]SNC76689.1 Barrel-sandwich domain of CusB or HlyD membrane-fusion [Hymenobacter gelipurpurascens]
MKKLLGVLLVVLVALSSWGLPLLLAPATTPATASEQTLTTYFVAEGSVIAPAEETPAGQDIRTARAGRVWEVYFSVGQRVRKGQVLLKLAHSIKTVEQQHLQTQIAQEQARYAALAQQPATAPAALTAARAQLVTLQEKLARTSPALAFEFVTAPEDGLVTARSVAPGDYLTPAQAVAAFVPGMPADTTLLLSSVE